MRVVGLADIHGNATGIKKMASIIEAADLVLIIGDLTDFGGEKQALNILSLIEERNSRILAVPGNCDFKEVEESLNKKGFNLHGGNRLFQEVCFIGLGYSLFTPGRSTPGEFSDDDLRQCLLKASSKLLSDSPLILVSHQPPFQTVADSVAEGEHVGSKSVRGFIEDYQPLICFSGHIHEGMGIDAIGKTKIVNPGPLFSGKYVYAEFNAEGVEKLEIREV